MKEYYTKQLEALEKAFDLCKENGCQNALPFINQRIYWLRERLMTL